MMGDSVERNWAEAMAHFIGKKALSAQKPGYAVHDEQWLMIYDNWQAFALERQHALLLLQERLALLVPFSVFSRVFILTGKVLIDLSADSMLIHRQMSRRPVARA